MSRSAKISDIDYPHILTYILNNVADQRIHSVTSAFINSVLGAKDVQTLTINMSAWDHYLTSDDTIVSFDQKSLVLNWFVLEFIPKITVMGEFQDYTHFTVKFIDTLTHFYTDLIIEDRLEIEVSTLNDLFPNLEYPRAVTILNALFKLLHIEYVSGKDKMLIIKLSHKISHLIECTTKFEWLNTVSLNLQQVTFRNH